MGLLLTWVVLAVGVSFLCSLLEAVLLSVRRSALVEARERGSAGAALLLRYKRERLDDAISAILTLNTISHTVGAALAGAEAAHVAHGWGWSEHETLAVGVFSAILTVLILVLSEIVPKTIGAVHAAPLAGGVGRILHWMVVALAPCLVVTRLLTRFLTRRKRAAVSRGEIRAILSEALGEGTLSADEGSWHVNLLRLEDLRVADVHTPRTVVSMMPQDATIDDLLAAEHVEPFSRIPLHTGSPDQVVGYVYQREVLRALARGVPGHTKLATFVRPMQFVPDNASIRTVLRTLLSANLHVAMTVDEHGGVTGLVSLEDITETLFGTEFVDESDRVADLREEALRLREKRLNRLRAAPARGEPGSGAT